MRIKVKILAGAISAFAIVAGGASVIAQSAQEKAAQEKPAPVTKVFVQNVDAETHGGQIHAMTGPGADHFVFVSSEMSFSEKMVKGAPYSAEAVTEMTQTLADGNRIVNRNTASVARDSEGRTRREQTLRAIGPYAAAGDPPRTLFINDPVSGVSYVLDQNSKTARKIELRGSPNGPNAERMRIEKKVAEGAAVRSRSASADDKTFDIQIATAGGPPGVRYAGPPPMVGGAPGWIEARTSVGAESKKESLGTQTIEGVACEGTRVIRTIAAGEIGNEAPINIVSERWYSPELQTVVLDKNSDPRMGEHVFRLTNINRSEPAKSLFEVPADYTIKDTMGPMIQKMREPQRTPRDN